MFALNCVPLFQLNDTTTIYQFTILLYTSVLVSIHNCLVDLYNGDIQTTTVSFAHNATSPKTDWILIIPRLLCLAFQLSYTSRMFMFSFARELYRNCIVVCVFSTHCLLLRSRTCLSPSLSHCCWWFTCNKLASFVCVVVGVALSVYIFWC